LGAFVIGFGVHSRLKKCEVSAEKKSVNFIIHCCENPMGCSKCYYYFEIIKLLILKNSIW